MSLARTHSLIDLIAQANTPESKVSIACVHDALGKVGNLNERDKDGLTPLAHVVLKAPRDPKWIGIFKKMLQLGADPNVAIEKYSLKISLLHMILDAKIPEIPRYLLLSHLLAHPQTNPNVLNPHGATPMHVAANNGDTVTLTLLHRAKVKIGDQYVPKANLHKKNASGQTAFDIAEVKEDKNVIRTLRAMGAYRLTEKFPTRKEVEESMRRAHERNRVGPDYLEIIKRFNLSDLNDPAKQDWYRHIFTSNFNHLQKDSNGSTILHELLKRLPSHTFHLEWIMHLIGKDRIRELMEIKDEDGRTPLLLCMMDYDLNKVKLLLLWGANITTTGTLANIWSHGNILHMIGSAFCYKIQYKYRCASTDQRNANFWDEFELILNQISKATLKSLLEAHDDRGGTPIINFIICPDTEHDERGLLILLKMHLKCGASLLSAKDTLLSLAVAKNPNFFKMLIPHVKEITDLERAKIVVQRPSIITAIDTRIKFLNSRNRFTFISGFKSPDSSISGFGQNALFDSNLVRTIFSFAHPEVTEEKRFVVRARI